MNEYILNLHMHTIYSDGLGKHADILEAAFNAGIDAVIVTDHNVLVEEKEGVFQRGDKQVVMLIGEEVHDQARQPQKNHLLVFGAGREMAQFAWNSQKLIDQIGKAGGLSFIAHPFDPPFPLIGELDISWIDWDVKGFTGIELWNGMSEFKSLLKNKLHGIFYAYNPSRAAHGPLVDTLKKWDELLTQGRRVYAVGGSDAHAFSYRLSLLHRIIFPYEFHFRAINTHLLAEEPISGDLDHDRRLILEALGKGRTFVGYDLPAPTKGFRFTANGMEKIAQMGEEIHSKGGITFQIRLPSPVECHLVKNGQKTASWDGQINCTYITTEPGIYRVEAYIRYKGRKRGWIFSNPIFVL